MENKNPQNKDLVKSKKYALAQDVFGVLVFILAFIQAIVYMIPSKNFLALTGFFLVVEFVVSKYRIVYFDKAHHTREIGLLDNSFNQKRIPNYNSDLYYNNESIPNEYIKLLANIHENALFTWKITEKMSNFYFVPSTIVSLFFLVKLFISGMDDYSSILLGFIVSSSFFDKGMKISSLKKSSESIFERASEICNLYEKNQKEVTTLVSSIIELLLIYENVIFESKIVLNEKIFKELNPSLTEEWKLVRDGYSIYSDKERDLK